MEGMNFHRWAGLQFLKNRSKVQNDSHEAVQHESWEQVQYIKHDRIPSLIKHILSEQQSANIVRTICLFTQFLKSTWGDCCHIHE